MATPQSFHAQATQGAVLSHNCAQASGLSIGRLNKSPPEQKQVNMEYNLKGTTRDEMGREGEKQQEKNSSIREEQSLII